MQLESIGIGRFRSIASASLNNIGGFNVLIGKNNSGKSNILSAIDTFFDCLHDGNVATLTPPFGDQIDFFNKLTDSPIEITAHFILSLPERDALLQDIVGEAPQMKNATEDVSPSLRLSTTVRIVGPPQRFSFVSSVLIENISTSPQSAKKTILGIADASADELYKQLFRSRELSNEADELVRFIRNDYVRYLFQGPDPSRPGRRGNVSLLPQYFPQLTLLMRRTLDPLLSEASSQEEFIRTVEGLITTKREEVESIRAETLTNRIRTFAGEESHVPDYAQNVLRKLGEIKVLHLKDRRNPIGNEEAERILGLKTQRGGLEQLRNLQEPIETLLGVRIDAFDAQDQGARRRMRGERTAELDVDDFLVAVNGSGIKEGLRVILDVEFEQPNILLVEEPEIHLHPALEISMMRYLKRITRQCQVFLTTHSTNFLDTPEMKNVYLISKTDSTQIQHINLEEAEVLIPKELGLRLSSLFMFDRLVFVEGESDEGILREVASLMKVNFSQSNVGFVVMEGSSNFSHYAQERVLTFLTKRQVKMFFLLDHDEREDAEIARIKERCGENATMIVLTRREVENYLICPRALVEFIKIKREKSGSNQSERIPTQLEIKDAIEECAEELKQLAIDKRVAKLVSKPFYPSRKRLFPESSQDPITKRITDEVNALISKLEGIRDSVEQSFETYRKSIDEHWDADKSTLVPGDILIDNVCRRYGVRFKKEQDSALLASLLREDEIDPEIKEIVQQLAG